MPGLALSGAPKIKRRLLNHWDNLDGTVERGYAGRSLWNWSALPATISQRYTDYARANASIGINGTVLNNVNANAQVLTAANLDKVAALADAFRPYGISVYLIGALQRARSRSAASRTADPTNAAVKTWWTNKVTEIYTKIPDFGGFLVKANSEGQPGPQDYSRTHADGAKMLSDALGTRGGVVLWRAFVYTDNGMDRIRQAYDEFKPLDGMFGANAHRAGEERAARLPAARAVQPAVRRDAEHAAVALELQITKEYLGEDTHLAYLGPLFEEVLKSDTVRQGRGLDGGARHRRHRARLHQHRDLRRRQHRQRRELDRLALQPGQLVRVRPHGVGSRRLGAATVADEWVRQTFSNDPAVVDAGDDDDDGVAPDAGELHDAARAGAHHGDRPSLRSGAVGQQPQRPRTGTRSTITRPTAPGSASIARPRRQQRRRRSTRRRCATGSRAAPPWATTSCCSSTACGWDDTLSSSGRSIWNELVHRYSLGVDGVQTMRDALDDGAGADRRQALHRGRATSCRPSTTRRAGGATPACTYFASVSGKTIPSGYAAPAHDLACYKDLATPLPEPTPPSRAAPTSTRAIRRRRS